MLRGLSAYCQAGAAEVARVDGLPKGSQDFQERIVDEITEDVTIGNPLGLHARPAATLVQTALGFQCDIHVQMNGRKVNAKSIMGLLTLAAAHGTVLTVICKGSDAREAMDALQALVESGFGEGVEGA